MASASYAVGIDYLKDEVEIIKGAGPRCLFWRCYQPSEVDLQETFDVIVCGELIEHISNPGLMLDGIKDLCMTSRSYSTTPNPWRDLWIRHIILIIMKKTGLIKNMYAGIVFKHLSSF